MLRETQCRLSKCFTEIRLFLKFLFIAGSAFVFSCKLIRVINEKFGRLSGLKDTRRADAVDAMSLAVGIDLGTTNSCVAVLQNGKVEVIANDFGKRTTPSVVAFLDSEEKEMVGEAALNQASRNPLNTISEVKRLMGRDWNDRSVLEDVVYWQFEVVDMEGHPRVRLKHQENLKTFSPVEISAMVLRKMKDSAEAYLGQSVKDAVITTPAYFTERQRRATKEAGESAGLRVLGLIPEPTAAVVAYGIAKQASSEAKTVLVYDLGGGTFDVSIASVNGALVEVKGIGGNTHLGGYDFDQRIVKHVAQEILRKSGRDLRGDPKKMRRLLSLCERAKCDLAALTVSEIDLESLVADELTVSITRAKFEDLCKDLLTSTMDTVMSVLATAKMQPGDIDEVILVGGSTRMPCVQRMLQDLFPGKEVCKTINPDEAVASGAALWAASLSGDKSPLVNGMVLQNVTPLSIGIAAGDGEYFVIIPRNSTLPYNGMIRTTTAYHNQTNIPCRVYEGERLVAARNRFVGEFVLEDLPAAPAGLIIEMLLQLDEDGLLTVLAKVHSSQRWQGCALHLDRSSSSEVVEHVVDATRYKEEDEREVQRLRARLQLDKYLTNVAMYTTVTRDAKKRAGVQEAVNWLASNQDATEEEFRVTLEVLKLKLRTQRMQRKK